MRVVRTGFCALFACGLLAAPLGPVSAASAAQAQTSASTTVKTTTSRKPTAAQSARARRARLARARASARARELAELQIPRFKLDDAGMLVPDVRAEAAVIYNPVTQQILWSANADEERSIASMTKIMTASVFLEDDPDFATEVVVQRADVRAANTTFVRAGERVRFDDLLHLMLVASDNAAARALARSTSLGDATAFIARMNEKAQELGLAHTRFTDPSGLDAGNVSTAREMAELIAFASADERIAAVMRKNEYRLRTNRRTIEVHSTNRLLDNAELDVRGGKTGFITKAGYCLATLLQLPQSSQQIAVVIMGARSNAARFMETQHLINWFAGRVGGPNEDR
jgi:D-alanyl-D-alanine endopeptidase (penicillin-binding protein 7)